MSLRNSSIAITACFDCRVTPTPAGLAEGRRQRDDLFLQIGRDSFEVDTALQRSCPIPRKLGLQARVGAALLEQIPICRKIVGDSEIFEEIVSMLRFFN